MDESPNAFRKAFARGFADPLYLEQWRRPLAAAHAQAAQTLGRDVLGPRVSQSQFDQAVSDAVTVLRLPGAFPDPWAERLESALSDPEDRRDFTIRLNGLLHIDQPIEQRFEGFIAVLARLAVLDWPLATVFPALVFPDRFALVDPASWPDSACALPDRPDWAAYRHTQQTAHRLNKRLAVLDPTDLLDFYAWSRFQSG